MTDKMQLKLVEDEETSVIVERESEFITIDECLELFHRFLLGCTYTEDQINKAFWEHVDPTLPNGN